MLTTSETDPRCPSPRSWRRPRCGRTRLANPCRTPGPLQRLRSSRLILTRVERHHSLAAWHRAALGGRLGTVASFHPATPPRSSSPSTPPPFAAPPPDPTDLRLHDVQMRSHQQPHLPTELMGEQRRPRLSAVLREAEQVPELDRCAVPVGALQDLEGHWRRIVARSHLMRIKANLAPSPVDCPFCLGEVEDGRRSA